MPSESPPASSQTAPDWRDLFRRWFDPTLTLRGEDLDLYVERDRSPVKEIRLQLDEEWDRAPKFFLAGAIGGGKSTELAQLQRALWHDYAVIGLDVYASTADITKLRASEVLFMMGAAACRMARDTWGEAISPEATGALFDAFKALAAEPDRLNLQRLIDGTALLAGVAADTLGGAGGVASTLVKGAAGVVTARPFGGLARDVRDGDSEIDQMAQALAGVLAEVARIRPPVLIVDGLDKVDDELTIREIFLRTRLLGLPPCPVVYAGPISLWYGMGDVTLASHVGFKMCPLPNVPTEPPVAGSARMDDALVRGGRAALRSVVAKRFAQAGYDLSDVIDEDALELIITASGGVMRDLVRLVHHACRRASRQRPVAERISLALAEAAFDEAAEGHQFFASSEDRVKELLFVETRGKPSGEAVSGPLLAHGCTLAYKDHVPWFRAHPFVRPLLR